MIRSSYCFTSATVLSMLISACASSTSPETGGANDGTNVTAHGVAPGASTGYDSVKNGTATDTDGDGVADDRDLSPATPKGTPVDSDGVPVASGTAPSTWGAEKASAVEVPVSGTVEANGFMDIVLDPKAKFPLVFRTLARNVQTITNGFHVNGTLVLATPVGNVPIFEADATFEHGASSTDIEKLTGRARVAFTDFGTDNFKIDAPYAELGYDVGANLKKIEVNAPLTDDRKYLYFEFSDKLGIEAGPLSISAPGGQSHTVVLDASDPYFFVRADLGGLGKIGEVLQDVGIGISRQGLIPFTPKDTWGITNPKPLAGHMYLDMSASMKLPDLPISLDGTGDTVINLDPAGNGDTIFKDPQNGMRIGGNRELDMSLELIPDVAALSLELGEATIEADLLKSTQTAWASGVMYPGKSVLGDVLGVIPANDVKFAGFVSSSISDSYFDMAGESQLELSKLGDLTGLTISDIPLAEGRFHVAKDGVAMSGKVQASFLSALGIGAGATLDGKFPGNPHLRNDWYVNLAGGLSVSGVDLSANASAKLSSGGLHVDGSWQSPLGQSIAMSGDITRDGFQIAGTASATIPVAGWDCTCKLPKMCDQDQYCNQAKQCSVPSTCSIANSCNVPRTCSVSCSANPLSWGNCLKQVTDAAKCGVDYVANGAVCGYHTVTSAAECGTHIVRDATQCGVEAVKCGVTQVQCGTIDAVGAVCGAVCDGKIEKALGQFVGTVHLSIGSDGLSGTVEGDYEFNGSTTKLAGGRLDLTSTPKACITIPSVGEACHEF
jgi:hypothetical protein